MHSPAEAVARAQKIDGWMGLDELEWLARVAGTCRTIIEVGSWKGRSTKALAMAAPGVVFAVDHWLGSESRRSTAHKEAVEMGPDKFMDIFKGNLSEEIQLGKVIPIRADSSDAVLILERLLHERGPADMVFIDADHTYESVAKDIRSYAPLVRAGGILSGHDYAAQWPGVMKAVDELISERALAAGSIWHAVKR